MSVMSLPLPRPARALRLELKRNAVPYVLPLLAAVFYFDTLRTAGGFPPVWTVRSSAITNHMLIEFSAFAGGLAAWAGSREGRRKTADLVAATPRAAWARLSTALAGTLCWLLLAFLAGAAVLYIQTALQATWGGPPLWPVFAGAAGVAVVTVIGFTCGVFFPGRFTAPLVAIGVLVLDQIGFREALGVTAAGGATIVPSPPASAPYALLSPDASPPLVDAGAYYHVAPDLAIAQVMFMGGIAVALFGMLGLAPKLRQAVSADGLRSLRTVFAGGDGWLSHAVSALLIACGVTASWTAFALAGTAQLDTVTGGWKIPALHSAASDRPVPAAQDCTSSSSGFRICVHPAFSFYLHGVAAALYPVADEIAGLPGAPAGASEVASVNGGNQAQSGISGNPPVFQFTAERVGTLFGEFYGYDPVAWREEFQQGLLDAFLTRPSQHAGAVPNLLDPAQLAVANGLLTAVGSEPMHASNSGQPAFKSDPATVAEISAAAQRFARLSASARHAWLATHLGALRAGAIRLAQIP
jgi:hypothetical protein